MSLLSDVQSFIDISRELRNPADLDALLQSITRTMGFDHFALIHHVDLTPISYEFDHMTSGQLIALSDYPEEWVYRYVAEDIVTDDPVLLASQRTNVGFAWSDIPNLVKMTKRHRDQMERGRSAGIGDGFTVPSNVPGEANGSCNFVVRAEHELPNHEQRMMAQLIGSYAFEAARSIVTHARTNMRQQVRLTPRQIECVALIGRGKTDWEVAQILGLSESTVKDYVDEARARYDVTKRMQLVVRAVYDGHIPLTDLLR